MKKAALLIVLFTVCLQFAQAQTMPFEIPKGYRWQHRIKGPEYKNSEVLELAVDEYGNYLVATFRGEKSCNSLFLYCRTGKRQY